MATLFLLCGLPGAGKTTLARRLEAEHAALRLTPDEWVVSLLADPADLAERDRLRGPVEALQWQVAARALQLGVSVILDWGFWSRPEREEYAAQAAALGATTQIHVLTVPREELQERLRARNRALPPGTLAVTPEELDRWWDVFEPSAADAVTDR